jgi:hypothetical protein
MMFAFGAFLGFVQYVSIAEFITVGRAAMRQLVLRVHLIVVFAVLLRFVANLAAVLLMLLAFFVDFVTMVRHFKVIP